MNHTTAPWQSSPSEEFKRINGNFGLAVAIWTPPGFNEPAGEQDEWPNLIAYCDQDYESLIKAAPELLTALQLARSAIAACIPHSSAKVADLSIIDSAIRKATAA